MEVNLEIIVPIHNITNRRNNLVKILGVVKHASVNFIIVSDSRFEHEHEEVRGIVINSNYSDSRVVTGQFGNPGMARNAGLAIARAEWVSFLDSDDNVNLEEVLKLIRNATCEKANLALGGIRYATTNSQTTQEIFLDSRLSILNNISVNPAFTRMVFRRSLITGLTFPDFRMAEDQCFLIEVFALEPKIYSEALFFYSYVLGDQSQSIRNSRALHDLPVAINHVRAGISNTSPALVQMRVTIIVRLSITYFKTMNFFPVAGVFDTLKTLARVFLSHPIFFVKSTRMIVVFRKKVI